MLALPRRLSSGYATAALLITVVMACSRVARGDLIAFYPLDGNANDASGNGNHGTVTGATPTPGFQGEAYDFTGDDVITLPVNINPSVMEAVTLGAWANADTTASLRTIVSHDNGNFDRGLTVDNRGDGAGARYSAFTGSGLASLGPDPVPVDVWTFVSARYFSGQLVLDVGGERASFPANPGVGLDFTTIGKNPTFNEFFDGQIDNVFIYNEFLTDERIDDIRQRGAPAIIPEPTGLALLGLCGVVLVRRRRGR